MDVVSLEKARSEGLKHYFTGKPCKFGHVSPRKVSCRSCMVCNALYSKDYYWKNTEKGKLRSKRQRELNPEYYRLRNKTWQKVNSARIASNVSKRKAQKLQATPIFTNHDLILEFYVEAERRSVETGIKHHVDHIVPLQSDLVCGLHWEGNLQILEFTANISKGNRIWPDMSPWTPELRKLVRDFKQANNK